MSQSQPQSQPITAFEIAADGWQTGIGILFRAPQLFISALVILLPIDSGFHYVGAGIMDSAALLGSEAVAFRKNLLGFAQILVSNAVSCAVLVAVFRQVLLHESPDHPVWRPAPTYIRFFLWALGLMVIAIIPYGALLSLTFGIIVGAPATLFGTLGLLSVVVVGCVIVLRSLLLLPALAVAAPGATLRNAWRDSKGHVLRMLGTLILAMLPLFGLAIVVFLVGTRATWPELLAEINGPPAAFGINMILMDILPLVIAAVIAVVASRLFQAHTNALSRP